MTNTPTLPVHMRRDQFEPDPELARLRTEAPVSRIDLSVPIPSGAKSAWLVTRHEDIREVLGDPRRFSNAALALGRPSARDSTDGAQRQGPMPGSLVADDPPEHTRLRRMLTPEFTVKRMRRLEPRIEAIVNEHLAAMATVAPPVDLVESFALPIPSLVICELLGVPYADRAEFQRRGNERLDISKPMDEQATVVAEAQNYMAELVARQRAEPGEDLLGMLVSEHGDELTDAELVAIGDLLLLAGHETTANMLGLGTALLLRDPEQLTLLRENDEVVDTAVEELLRYLSVVQSTVRAVVVDTVIAGQELKAGDVVLCSLSSGNRDGNLGGALGRLDLTRKPLPHVAFGHGIHHCLGAPLARMEMRIAFPALLRRFPGLRLAVPFEEIAFRAFSIVYGVKSLPVTW